MRGLRLLVVPAVLCAVLLGGCFAGPREASVPRTARSSVADLPPVEPSGTVVVAHPRQPVEMPGGQSAGGDLMGFAVRVKLRWRVTTDQLSADTARLLQLDNPSPTAPLLDLKVGLHGAEEGSASIIFEVPAGLTGATLHITVTGAMTAQYRTGEFATRWNKTPPPADATLTASPL